MDATHPFVVVDMQARTIVARTKTRAGARRSADRRDNEYGGIRYRALDIETARACGYSV